MRILYMHYDYIYDDENNMMICMKEVKKITL